MIIFHHTQVISVLASFLESSPLIVEAGAFNGLDSKKMATRWPDATVHAFEPVDEIYASLVENTKNYPNIYCYHTALSTQTGTASFFVSEHPLHPGIPSQAGSLHAPKDRLFASPLVFPYTMTVNTISLAEWIIQNNISFIDLLWLDTQGHELAVLTTVSHWMENIRLVLTEVSFIESYENQPKMNDIIAWMKERNFIHIGSDFKNTTDNFFGNLLFINARFY